MKITKSNKPHHVAKVGDICIGTNSGDPYLICIYGRFHYGVVNLANGQMKTTKYDSIEELVTDWGFKEFIPSQEVELILKG